MPCRVNALSVDLEEWHHPELIRGHAGLPKVNLIHDSARILLRLLDNYKTKATFFVLGETANRCPDLIKEIHEDGHEIASHGFSHSPLYRIGPEGLRMELAAFKKVICGILGDMEIKGFRAPTFSFNQNTRWAVNILKEYGFRYDSSIFPIKINAYYGMKGAPLDIYGLDADDITKDDRASSLKEFPLTAFKVWGFRLPVSGGFYSRLIPLRLRKSLLESINKSRPFIIYIHPWECHKATPRIRLNVFSRFISYYNIGGSLDGLKYLLQNFRFGRVDTVLGV